MWKLNNIRIIATDEQSSDPQIIARLNPLGGGTVHQVFGYEDRIRRINCVVVGHNDMTALRALAKTGSAYTLRSYDGNEGSYLVNSVEYTRTPIWRQTVRRDLPDTSPVFRVALELYQIV